MITERTLKRWRRESLKIHSLPDKSDASKPIFENMMKQYIELHSRILRLTQELLDQHLMRKE